VNHTSLIPLDHRDATYLSAFFTLPFTLHTEKVVVLKLCFATREMGNEPVLSDYTELGDTLTVIPRPHLGAYTSVRSISGTSPDFTVLGAPHTGGWGIDAGDYIYFRDSCDGPIPTPQNFATVALRTVKYDDSVLGYLCNSSTAFPIPAALKASSVRGKLPNEPAVEEWCGDVEMGHIGSATAWCSAWTSALPKEPTELLLAASSLPTNNVDPWLQMDAGSSVTVTAVQTQGRYDAPEWVKTFNLAISTDGETFAYIVENGDVIEFDANIDRDSVATNALPAPMHAQYVRIFPRSWHGQYISMRAGLLACFIGVRVMLPRAPALVSAGYSMRELMACYATRRSEGDNHDDYVPLLETLKIIPEPTDPEVVLELPRGEIFSIPWVHKGRSVPGAPGDIFVLSTEGCDDIAKSSVSIPFGPSGVVYLGQGGVVGRESIYGGQLNELNSGYYKFCYATKESLGDSNKDFSALSTTATIFVDSRAPVLHVAPDVVVGQDIVVGWEANNKLDGRVSHSEDWIGLYREGECVQVDYYNDVAKSTSDRSDLESSYQLATSQNKCFIAASSLPEGLDKGEIRFSSTEYQHTAGVYELRYFLGDSTGGAGYVCRGVQQTDSEAFKTCALEAKTKSSIVHVKNTFADGSYQHLSAQDKVPQAAEQELPGLETFCFGGECTDVSQNALY